MTERDAVFLPLRELAERVRARQVSPAALTRLFLDRLERLGPRYHAVVTLTAELAESQARQAEREIAAGRYRGPLHGIPYGLKDLFATACYPTTWGAGPLREQAFDYDATIVRKLQAGGAVLAAKLALVELAGGARYGRADASFTGPGLNPWDRGVWSGGSSDVRERRSPRVWCRSRSAPRPGVRSWCRCAAAACPGCVRPSAG